jgi:hypothetical protein
LLSISFHIIFLHHCHITNCLRIIQSLLKFVHLFAFTQFRGNSRLKYFCDFKLARLDKIDPTCPFTLPIDHILPLVLLFFKEKGELTECRLIDPLANLEAHKEVEHAIESLLDLTEAHPLEVFL